MILISNLVLNISDGSTLASTDIYGADKKTYINIGSGNVFRLHWDTPTLANDDTVDYYKLVIKRQDTTLNVYYDIFDKNIGLVNEFYVDSALLPTVPLQYKATVYIIAYGKQGSIVSSNVVTPYISKGTGAYIKATPTGYNQSIMKRAIAFVNAPTSSTLPAATLLDSTGNELVSKDGNKLAADATRVLASSTWNIALTGYTKNSEGEWLANDIKHEVLVDQAGDIITDSANKQIYVL